MKLGQTGWEDHKLNHLMVPSSWQGNPGKQMKNRVSGIICSYHTNQRLFCFLQCFQFWVYLHHSGRWGTSLLFWLTFLLSCHSAHSKSLDQKATCWEDGWESNGSSIFHALSAYLWHDEAPTQRKGISLSLNAPTAQGKNSARRLGQIVISSPLTECMALCGPPGGLHCSLSFHPQAWNQTTKSSLINIYWIQSNCVFCWPWDIKAISKTGTWVSITL